MPMGYHHGGFFGGFAGRGPGVFGILLFIVFWAAVALLVLTLIQNYRRGPHHLHGHMHGHGLSNGPDTGATARAIPAIDLLKERFAKGEVNEEEFTRRLTLLKES